MRPTIKPKSDQLNADDLIAGPLVITITDVRLREGDQPIAIHHDKGLPYLPCKSMRRLMVRFWGDDGTKYAGHRLELFRDEKVKFGGESVGGIRISRMSGVERETTVPLTEKRGKSRAYTVKPIVAAWPKPKDAPVDLTLLVVAGRAAAASGEARLDAWWAGLGKDEQRAAKAGLLKELGEMRTTAREADAGVLGDDDGFPTFDAPSPLGEPAGAAEGERADPPGRDNPPAQPSSPAARAGAGDNSAPEADEFDPLTWAAEEQRLWENFTTVAELDAHTRSAESGERFGKLQAASPGMAKALEAALNGRRKALADRERG